MEQKTLNFFCPISYNDVTESKRILKKDLFINYGY